MRSTALILGTSLVLLSAPASSPHAQAQGPKPCFDATGGPTGDFDWHIETGDFFLFDTTLTTIVGGPGGAPTTVQTCVNGVVDVRNLVIEEGGLLRVQGPNPMRILATGDVVVRGRLDVSGFNAHAVATLNTGNQIELGAVGGPGGARGGNANPVTTNSSPRGLDGQGPFGLPNAGGQGGETGYASAALGKDARRPGGGGGGRFARDQGPGLVAQEGGDGAPTATGAVSGLTPAQGGSVRSGPFVDARSDNDFFGEAPRRLGRVLGELLSPWGGYGGGGGGNADPATVFPTPSWNISSDEKGAGGGGGGGVLHIQALGRIVFGAAGEILSLGGRGGTGENTFFLDHIGGSGGSGSGGHVVLESATEVDFTDGGANAGVPARDWLNARGGARVVGTTTWVPPEAVGYSNGGAGGPGVLQIHVPDPTALPGTNPDTTDIVVPSAVTLHRNPLDGLASPAAIALYLTCDPAPRARHGWIGSGGRDARRAFLRVVEASGKGSVEDAHGADDGLPLELDRALEAADLELPRRP